MTYPPAPTDPSLSSTPERTRRLGVRGSYLPAVDFAMFALQQLHPRRVFLPENDRLPSLCPIGWRRGGTSPGGADVGGPKDASYFVGSSEEILSAGMPQRIVWVPRGADWGPPTTVGSVPDVAPDDAPPLLVPENPATRSLYRSYGDKAAAPWASRIIRLDAHVWGHDFDDTDDLVGWLGTCWQLCFQGTAGNEPVVGPEDWIPDAKGSRGLHVVLSVKAGTPVFYPPDGEARMRSAFLRLSGQAPHAVVEP